MPDLSEADVARAATLIDCGKTYREVVDMLHVSKSVIHRVVKRLAQDDRFIVLQSLRNRTSSTTTLKNTLEEVRGVALSTETIRKRLKEKGIRSYRAATGPLLTTQHRVQRLRYAQNHGNWNLRHWSHVLFTDESRFCLHPDDRRVKVWRRPGERYAQCNVAGKVAFGGGSVMVWGGICLGGRTELYVVDGGALTAERYKNEILERIVVPFLPFIGQNATLMHDNARPHTARVVTEYLNDVDLQVLNHPARSPDMNPIEHVWDELGRRIKGRTPTPGTLRALKEALTFEWDRIPQETIDNLIRGMPRRLTTLQRARGGNTRY